MNGSSGPITLWIGRVTTNGASLSISESGASVVNLMTVPH